MSATARCSLVKFERAITEASMRANGSAFGGVSTAVSTSFGASSGTIAAIVPSASVITEATCCCVSSIVFFCKSRALARNTWLSSVRPEFTRMRPKSTYALRI